MVSVTECHTWDRVSSPFFSTNLQLALLRDWLLAAFPSSNARGPLTPEGHKPARLRSQSEGVTKSGQGENTGGMLKDTSGRSPPFFRLACKGSGCISPTLSVNEQLVETAASHAEVPLRPTSEGDTSTVITASSTDLHPRGFLCCPFSYH